MDWLYEHKLLYHYVKHETIQLVWTEKLDLLQSQQWFFNHVQCYFKVTIVAGM